jgi:hypothetical protein
MSHEDISQSNDSQRINRTNRFIGHHAPYRNLEVDMTRRLEEEPHVLISLRDSVSKERSINVKRKKANTARNDHLVELKRTNQDAHIADKGFSRNAGDLLVGIW